jgi:hypothetical protein
MLARYLRSILVLGVLVACFWDQPALAGATGVLRHRRLIGRKCCGTCWSVSGTPDRRNSSGCTPIVPPQNSSPHSPSKTVSLRGELRRVLEVQRDIYEGAVRLGRLPEEERGRNMEIEAAERAKKQLLAVGDVEKLILLLRKDGTTVGFIEALEAIRDDMQTVAHRLAENKVDDRITQAIQIDIIQTLEEMLGIFDHPAAAAFY